MNQRPIFDFSDTWQLVINTGTTIVTFLMVFLIQTTHNCHQEALQVKRDEDELENIRKDYAKLAKQSSQ